MTERYFKLLLAQYFRKEHNINRNEFDQEFDMEHLTFWGRYFVKLDKNGGNSNTPSTPLQYESENIEDNFDLK